MWLYLACKIRYGAGKHIWKLLVTSLSTWVHNGCIVEGYIDFVPENLFSCMISKFLIVISKVVLRA